MVRVTLRLPEHLHRSLRSRCRETGASLNQLILDAVSSALGEAITASPPKTPLQLEVERIRRLLAPLVAPNPPDYSLLPEHLRPPPGLPDTDTLRESGPRGVNLSGAIIEEREDDTR